MHGTALVRDRNVSVAASTLSQGRAKWGMAESALAVKNLQRGGEQDPRLSGGLRARLVAWRRADQIDAGGAPQHMDVPPSPRSAFTSETGV